jgi:raffinose/stachyose/melibiose transport system substrate-binding protein
VHDPREAFRGVIKPEHYCFGDLLLFEEKTMKLTKKAALLFLGMVLATGAIFVGCSKNKGSGGTEQVTINFWHIETNELRRTILEEAIKKFEAQNPGVKINAEVYENEPFKTKLKTVSGDDFPDVFRNWGGGWLKSFVDAGLAADITAETAGIESKIGQANKDFASFDGKVYGLPYNGSATVLFYNKDIFAKYNLTPPKTLAELEQICQTLQANNITPFALGNLTKWTGAQHFVLLAMRIGGPDIFQQVMDKKAKFTDEPFIRAGQILSDQVARNYFPVGANGVNTDTGGERMMFYSGEYGMMVQLTGSLNTFKTENPDFFKKVGVAPYPTVEGGKGHLADHLAGAGVYSISSASRHKDIAVKFITFLSTDEEFQLKNVNTFQLPSLLGLKTGEPLMQDVLDMVATATYKQNFIDQTLSPALAEKHKDTTQAIYGKTMTTRQVGEEMQKAFDSGL